MSEIPGDLASVIESRWQERIRAKIRSGAHPTNRASMLGDPCLRRLVLYRTKGEQAEPPSERLQSIFEQGNQVESYVRRVLSECGIELESAQAEFPRNDYQITGHVDGLARWNGEMLVVEIKSINGPDWERITSEDDLIRAGKLWLRKWYDQLQVYLLLADLKQAVLVLYNKATGELKALTIGQNLARAEELTTKAELVNLHLAEGSLPDFIQDVAECRRCPFLARACDPPLDFGPGARVITDETLIELAETRERTGQAAEEYTVADKRLKEALRGVEQGIMGPYAITGRWQSFTRYDVPKEVKEQFKNVNPNGAFRLEIERVVPAVPGEAD